MLGLLFFKPIVYNFFSAIKGVGLRGHQNQISCQLVRLWDKNACLNSCSKLESTFESNESRWIFFGSEIDTYSLWWFEPTSNSTLRSLRDSKMVRERTNHLYLALFSYFLLFFFLLEWRWDCNWLVYHFLSFCSHSF